MIGIVTEEKVRSIEIPDATKSFNPVKNGEFLDMVEGVVHRHGLKMENGQFSLAGKKDQQMFATFDLIGQNAMDEDVRFKLGARNSCDKTFAAGLCFGSSVLVCSNLMFVAYGDDEYGIKGLTSHKHTVHINNKLYTRLMESFKQFERVRDWQKRFYTALRGLPMRKERAYTSIIKAARADIVNKTDILAVADYWDWQAKEPEQKIQQRNGVERVWHPEFQDRNAYSLLNAITEVQKPTHAKNPAVAANKSMALTKFLHQTLVPNLN